VKFIELKTTFGKRVLVETTGLIVREDGLSCQVFTGERSIAVANSYDSIVKALGSSKPTVCGD
jgi:hypothetical protein